MSLYNMLFERNPLAPMLLEIIGESVDSVGRFRDCFVCDGEIHVYTRNGGGNREEYEGTFEGLRSNPLYLRDFDDDFDCTYATICFRCPDELKPLLEFIGSISSQQNPGEKWDTLFRDLSSGNQTENTKRALEVGEKILGPLLKQLQDGAAKPAPGERRA